MNVAGKGVKPPTIDSPRGGVMLPAAAPARKTGSAWPARRRQRRPAIRSIDDYEPPSRERLCRRPVGQGGFNAFDVADGLSERDAGLAVDVAVVRDVVHAGVHLAGKRVHLADLPVVEG